MPLLYLLISAMPLMRDPMWERFMSDLTAIKYLGLACLLCALWRCLARRKLPPLWATPQSCWMVALCFWATISWLTLGPALAWDQSSLLSYVSFLALLAITLSLVDTWPRLGNVLWAMIVSVAIASLYILREWQEYHNVYRDFRPGWVTGDPNYFTASALIGLPLALAFCGRNTEWWKRYAAGFCALLTLAAIGLAASRGGLLGLAVVVVFMAWKRRHLRLLALAAVLCLPLLLVWQNSPLNRLLHPSVSDIRSSDTRLALWQAGLRMIAAHPLTGIGLGNFKIEVQHYAVSDYAVGGRDLNLDHIAHNAYMELAAEMGLPALALYGLILIGSQRSFAHLAEIATTVTAPRVAPPKVPLFAPTEEEAGLHPKDETAPGPVAVAAAATWPPDAAPSPTTTAPRWGADAALGLQAALLGFSVSACFLSAEYTKLFWLLVALSAAIQTLLPATSPAPAGERLFKLLEPAADA